MHYFLIIPTYIDNNNLSEIHTESIIIKAKNKKEAIKKYSLNSFELLDDSFREEIIDCSVNFGFAENFWFQTQEESEYFCSTGEKMIDDEEFKKRVRFYFKENKDFGELYIKFYFTAFDLKPELPEDFFKFLWIKKMQNIDERDYLILNLSFIKSI